MELQVGVKVLLKNKEGKYLLVKRNDKKYPEIGAKWDIVGGRINAGINLIENLKREVKEEVGLDLTYNPILVAAQDILKVHGRHVVRLTYTAVIDGEPKIGDDENTGLGWFTLEEMENLNLDEYFKEVLEKDLIQKYTIASAKALVENNGKYLIFKKDIGIERWDIPGGKIHFNESAEDALKREVREETGLDIEIEKPLGAWHFIRSDNVQVTCMTFLCRALDANVKISNKNESFAIEEFKWADKSELLNKALNPNLKALLKRVL